MPEAAERALASLGRELGCSAEDAARDVVLVAEAAMERAIRRISVERGHDPRRFTLVAFGGAGPLHACALAGALGIRAVLVPRHPGVLCALGALASGIVKDHARGAIEPLVPGGAPRIDALFAPLMMPPRGARARKGSVRRTSHSSGAWTHATRASRTRSSSPTTVRRRLCAGSTRAHEERFGHSHADLAVEITALRVRASSPGPDIALDAPPPARAPRSIRSGRAGRKDLVPGDTLLGPCAVDGFDATVWIDEGIGKVAWMRAREPAPRARPRRGRRPVTPATIEIFGHLFASAAEAMGTALQRTAFSPNIKERLDFSSAVFDGMGALVAQASHIPVHLGAMPASVDAVLSRFPEWREGDLAILNDPYLGGTHLPDITMVSPVFAGDDAGGARPEFFLASRAHHADVGGMSPGSMPLSRELVQEGIIIPPMLLRESDALWSLSSSLSSGTSARRSSVSGTSARRWPRTMSAPGDSPRSSIGTGSRRSARTRKGSAPMPRG